MGKEAMVPQWLTNAVYATKNLGFPIIAFCLMWYTCDHSLAEQSKQTHALAVMIEGLRMDTRKEHDDIKDKLKELTHAQQSNNYQDRQDRQARGPAGTQ